MSNQLLLKRNTLGATPAVALFLDGIAVSASPAESVYAEVYWRWDDDPAMEPELLDKGVSGHSITATIPNPKKRDIRFFLFSLTEQGVAGVRDFAAANQTVFTPAGAALDYGSNHTITTDENGSIFTNTGATALVTFTLPTLKDDLEYSFVVTDADGLKVTSTLDNAVMDGDSLSHTWSVTSTTIGSTLTIRAIDSVWTVIDFDGDWELVGA